MKIKGFILLVIIMVLCVGAKGQSHVNIAGKWTMEVQTSAGSGSPGFTLRHDSDTTVTGTYSGQLGSADVKGTVNGNKVHLEFSVQGNLVTYDGVVENDTMKGSVKLGTMAEGTFTGKKEKP